MAARCGGRRPKGLQSGSDRGTQTMRRALQIILTIAVFGLVFSGVLTYRELFTGGVAKCPSPGAPGTVFGYPASLDAGVPEAPTSDGPPAEGPPAP